MSDIDLLVVLRRPPSASDRREFESRFVDFQREHCFVPDERFPAEVVDVDQLKAAIAWHGIQLKHGRPIVYPIGPDGWTSDNEYRQWLCAAAGPNQFVSGDREKYHSVGRAALASASLMAIASSCTAKFTKEYLADVLISLGKEGLGFCDTPATRAFLESHLESALALLSEVSALRRTNGSYHLSNDVIGTELPSLLARRSSL